MVLTLLKRLLISINVFNHPIKPVKLELMISLSIAGKELESSRLSDKLKDIYFKAAVANLWSREVQKVGDHCFKGLIRELNPGLLNQSPCYFMWLL